MHDDADLSALYVEALRLEGWRASVGDQNSLAERVRALEPDAVLLPCATGSEVAAAALTLRLYLGREDIPVLGVDVAATPAEITADLRRILQIV